jgi:formylglycine-generating enzyme required for sulfatase activity
VDGEQRTEAITPAAFTPLSETDTRVRRRLKPWRWVIGGVLALFAMTMWFQLTARSVQLTLEPANADIDIDGGLHLLLGDRYLLRSGSYLLTLTADGYYPLAEELVVGPEDSQSFHYQLRKLPGILGFDSQPPGARVDLDGETLGETPLSGVTVAAGSHQLRLLADRYLPLEREIDVTGMEQPQQFSLSLDPAWANIAVDSVPTGATVLLDGEPVATTPATVEVLQGEHLLSVSLERYSTWQQELVVVPGEHQVLDTVTLAPAEAQLLLSSRPSRASVTVNGEFQGQTPVALALEPGTSHRVAVFKPGYSSVNRMVTLEAAQQQELTVTLPARLGEIRVQVYPPDAEIVIDGRARGRGSQDFSLPTFEQSLEVRAAGYQSQRQRITPRQGLSQAIAVRLLTESEARLANLKPQYRNSTGQSLKLFTPGDFTMGASRREAGRRANEVLHPVSLTRLFYLGTHEVTNGQFREFRQDHSSGSVEGNSLNRDAQPAVMVNWVDAALYCNWLSAREKLPPFYIVEGDAVTGFRPDATGYRLPTEAEWAWAARVRGETQLRYPWGESFPPTKADGNYADSASAFITGRTISGYKDGHVVSAPVGSFTANHNGLFDMGGNVAEWVHDVYVIPDSSGSLQVDPLGAQQANNHVIRGASWAHATITELRLSFRDYGKAARDDVGFRVARFAEGSQ